ncbi:MAG: hypothetical protein M0Z99_19190 [Betaproteobacteria bacterium]|nr:hypothetical protein [Betaproteobacteria bacterium]
MLRRPWIVKALGALFSVRAGRHHQQACLATNADLGRQKRLSQMDRGHKSDRTAYDLGKAALLVIAQISKMESEERMPSEFHRRVSASEVGALPAMAGSARENWPVKVPVGQKRTNKYPLTTPIPISKFAPVI